MHFVDVLAFALAMPAVYDPGLTLLSDVITLHPALAESADDRR